MRKTLLLALSLAWASALMAQGKHDSDDTPKLVSLASEFGLGNDFEAGFRVQMNTKYFSWDIIHPKYNVDFTRKKLVNELIAETGIRLFTPTFGNTSLRFVGALDFGYGGSIRKVFTNPQIFSPTKNKWSNHMALDYTLGLYVTKSLYIGYGMGILTRHYHHKDHEARIGIDL